MKSYTTTGLLLLLISVNQVFAQFKPDNPNLDQVPQYLYERASARKYTPPSSVITIGNWDNFSLGVDFAENNMAMNPNHPTWFFTAYNTNATHHTENGIDWDVNNPNFGVTMRGDPVVAYDSLGNLFYENMFGSSIEGCKVISSLSNGAAWGTPVTAIAGNDKNWIACDQTSGPYANYVYTTMTNGGPPGNFARSMDHGATFTSTFTPFTQQVPGMMVCVGPQDNVQGGAVYVVTNSGDNFNSTYTFYCSNDGGATFTLKSAQQWSNTVGTQVGGRNSVSNMRTRPYPFIAADNSYGADRGKLYCVYASNDPPGDNNKSDIFCRFSNNGGATWSNAVKVNTDVNTQNFQQWHPAIWCDKETGKLYVMWMDTRDTPTNDSAYIYASYSTNGGINFVSNQRISNVKMKIDCPTCGGGGSPRYEGDYNGVISNKKVSLVGWTDFRDGTFQSMTAYFPDFAMAIDHASDTLITPSDNAVFQVSIPGVKLYTDTVLLSAGIFPVPITGNIAFEYPSGSTITTFPATKPVKLVLTGNVPGGDYLVTFVASGPNGTPAHRRTATIKVLPEAVATATPAAICQGQTSLLNAVMVGGTPPFTYSWTPSASLSNPTIANPVATPNLTTTYHVTVTDNASHTESDTVVVTVNFPPTSAGQITGPQSVCSGETAGYWVNEIIGINSYSWTVPADAQILSGQNTASVSIKWGNTSGTLIVIVSNNCGQSPQSGLPVVVSPLPTTLNPITGPNQVCDYGNASFTTAILGPPDTYHWTVPVDAVITSGQGTNTINATWGITSGMVKCFSQNNCGTSPEITKTVGAVAIPAQAGFITGKDTICQGHGNYVYSVPAIKDATLYVWTLPVGVTISAGQGTNQVTLLLSATAQSGYITVKGQNICGEGIVSVKPVQVDNCEGIGQNILESSVRIFPNPATSELTLSITGKERQLNLTITDLNGKVQYYEMLTNISSDYNKVLNMSKFARGVYFVKLSFNNRVYSEKLIVQ